MAKAKRRKLKKRPDRSPMSLTEARKWDLTQWCPLKGSDWVEIKTFGNRRTSWYGVRVARIGATAAEFSVYRDFCDMVAGYESVIAGERAKRLRGYELTKVPGLFYGPSGDPEFPYGYQVGARGLMAWQRRDEALTWFRPLVAAVTAVKTLISEGE